MSITSALSNALTGLTAASRGVAVVSSNVANARTPGYGRRELELSSQVVGGVGAGVQVDGVRRLVDEGLLRELRLSDAALAGEDERLRFFSDLDALIGASGGENALSGGIARLHASLLEAASRPDSTARLAAVADAAGAVAGQLNDATDGVQAARMAADSAIGQAVEQLNADLARVVDLNVQIRTITVSGRDPSGLMDQRQRLIDDISTLIPLRVMPRDTGMVALYSTGGAALVESSAAQLSFSTVGLIVPEMTLASGALSALEINGKPVNTAPDGLIRGGRLAALFEVRDVLGPTAQASLDAMARDLVERFADPAVDPTLLPGEAGLFTDAGAAFDPLNEPGLAERIRLNPAVDPAGGDVWRLRAGIAALAPNDPGDSTLLTAMADALDLARAPASGPFAGITRSAGALAGEVAAGWSAGVFGHERERAYHESRSDTLREMHLRDGVDTDAEMQRLLVLEQAYAANARVISTVDGLLKALLEV